MKKILIVLFGVLIFQGYVFAETWEDRAANKVAWSAEFPDDPVCWNPPVGWNTDNPWIVGKGDHDAYYGLANCFRVCAENDTCYKDGWRDEASASATCELRGIDQFIVICAQEGSTCAEDADGPPWWRATTILNSIKPQGAGGLPGKLYAIAWCK